MEQHTRPFEKGLGHLRQQLVHMAELAEAMIDRTIAALVHQDESLIALVQEQERTVNNLQILIDEEVLTLLATQQPVAGDLRLVLAVTRINSELERIGDLAINITQRVHDLARQPPLKPLIDIPRMAELARGMVYQSIQAFIREDVAAAQEVILTDDAVDGLRDQILRELVTFMISDPRTIERALALILVSRHLERIGDHATNIAQDVIYMVQGQDVRHPKQPHPPHGGQGTQADGARPDATPGA